MLPDLPFILNQEALNNGQQRSVIRELFDYGQRKAKEIGAENIFDFSIGNPSIPPPAEVQQAFLKLLQERDPKALHGYTNSAGDIGVRQTIAASLNMRYGSKYTGENIFMTCGAAAALSGSFRALSEEGRSNEFILLAPYFPEYKPYIEGQQGKLVVVPACPPDFGIDLEEIEKSINPDTRAIVINSPNNPSGKLYSKEELTELARLLRRKSHEYNRPIFIVSDEPYRELVYDGKVAPHIPAIYEYTIMTYSYSKSLSIPGDRIGYALVAPNFKGHELLFAAIGGALRGMGYVCAPSLLQHMIGLTVDIKTDTETYDMNRQLLYRGLREIGYEVLLPEGAFYLFMKVPGGDAPAFSDFLRDTYNVLAVPSDSFGCEGYMRVSYCVAKQTIEEGLKRFELAFNEWQNK